MDPSILNDSVDRSIAKPLKDPTVSFSPWPHRLALLLAIVVFPLIWMGGTVTTYDAGMAVPDWPTTYSSWFYPIHLWLAVWDVFLEHGHRLLAQLAGVLAILLAIAIWRTDDRKWMRWLGVLIVVGVVAQGTLGGIRVWAGAQQGLWAWGNDRLLARIHGCIAPLYFGLCAAVVAWTSRPWRQADSPARHSDRSEESQHVEEILRRVQNDRLLLCASPESTGGRSTSSGLLRLAWLVTAAIYLEIVLGALLRRPSAGLGIVGDARLWGWLQSLLLDQVATWFELCVWLKVINAVMIGVGSAWLVVGVLRQAGPLSPWERARVRAASDEAALLSPATPFAVGEGRALVARRAKWFAAIVSLQLILAAATWVTNYGWPAWFTRYIWPLESSLTAQGRLLVLVTTAHAAIGSLTLVAALSLTLWLSRLLMPVRRARTPLQSVPRLGTSSAACDPQPRHSVFQAVAHSPSVSECGEESELAITSRQSPPSVLLSLLDYWRLTRPWIVGLVLLAMAVSAWVTARGMLSWTALAHALFGTAMVIAGAVALNQRLECAGDAKMSRTAGRPLPCGRLSRRQVATFGLAATAFGLAYLAMASGPILALLAMLGWVIYVGAYTPLKSRTVWQTPVGAAAGAMPVLLGAAAGGQTLNPWALVLFGIVFFWQFPHSMAIAWRYRREFAAAGVKVAPVTDPTGQTAGLLAIVGATALLVITQIPLQLGLAGGRYDVAVLILGTIYLTASASFAYRRNDRTARWLLVASFIYLLATLAVLLASALPVSCT